MMSTNYDELLELYRSRPAARELLDSILEVGVDEGRTTVDELTGDGSVSRRQAITLLRSLGEAGCGEFKVGRKGHPSRLEWTVDPAEVATRVVEYDRSEAPSPSADPDDELDQLDDEVASPAPARVPGQAALNLGHDSVPEASANEAPPQLRSETTHQASERMIEHSHVLRPNLRVSVSLPVDLTPREAEILADWIRNLSFERD